MSIACISSVFSVHTCLEYMGPNRREGGGGSKRGLIEGLPVCLQGQFGVVSQEGTRKRES